MFLSIGDGLRGQLSLPAADGGNGNGRKPLSRTHSSSSHAPLGAPLPSALLHDTPTLDPTAPHMPRSTTPNRLHSPVHQPHQQLLQHQQHQHLLLSAQASYDRNTYDAFRNQLFKSESSLYPLFTTHQQHMQQQQQLQHQQKQQQLHQQLHHQQQQPLAAQHIQQQMHQDYQHHQQLHQQPTNTWGYSPSRSGIQESPSQIFPDHMPVNKQLSDPDNVSSDNPHPKLIRQLTLNPANDYRLDKITKAATHQKSMPMIGQFGGLQTASTSQYQPGQQQQLPNMQLPSGQQQLSSYSSSLYHNPDQLPHSTQDSQAAVHQQQHQMAPLPPHMYQQNYAHPHVTRFSSAPDPIWGGGSSSSQYGNVQTLPTITRLNSTSDSHLNLNLYGSTDSPHFMSEPFDSSHDQQCRNTSYFTSHPGIVGGSSSPGPVGSRPMSPHQQTLLQHSRNQHLAQSPLAISKSSGQEKERSRLYYHLINLFPEDVVLAALAKHPNETDPHKICSSIIASKSSVPSLQSSSSAISAPLPQLQQQLSHQSHQQLMGCQSVPLPLRVPSPTNPSFPPNAAIPHEDSRLRDYLNPQPPSDGAMRPATMQQLAATSQHLQQQHLQHEQSLYSSHPHDSE